MSPAGGRAIGRGRRRAGLRDRDRCGAVGGIRRGGIERLPADRGRRGHRWRAGACGGLGAVIGGRLSRRLRLAEFSMAGIGGGLPLSSSVIAILKVPSTITTTLAPTSSERILEVIVDGSLAPAGILERRAGVLVAGRRGCGGLGGAARGGNEIRGAAGRFARAGRNIADGVFGSRDALRWRSGAAGRPRSRLERMIGRQFRRDRRARRRGMRLQNFAEASLRRADAAANAPALALRGVEFARGGRRNAPVPQPDSAIQALAAAASQCAARRLAAERAAAGRRRGADIAQIAFDHRQPVDHMAERVVNGFERILGVAVGFGLAEADSRTIRA